MDDMRVLGRMALRLALGTLIVLAVMGCVAQSYELACGGKIKRGKPLWGCWFEAEGNEAVR